MRGALRLARHRIAFTWGKNNGCGGRRTRPGKKKNGAGRPSGRPPAGGPPQVQLKASAQRGKKNTIGGGCSLVNRYGGTESRTRATQAAKGPSGPYRGVKPPKELKGTTQHSQGPGGRATPSPCRGGGRAVGTVTQFRVKALKSEREITRGENQGPCNPARLFISRRGGGWGAATFGPGSGTPRTVFRSPTDRGPGADQTKFPRCSTPATLFHRIPTTQAKGPRRGRIVYRSTYAKRRNRTGLGLAVGGTGQKDACMRFYNG